MECKFQSLSIVSATEKEQNIPVINTSPEPSSTSIRHYKCLACVQSPLSPSICPKSHFLASQCVVQLHKSIIPMIPQNCNNQPQVEKKRNINNLKQHDISRIQMLRQSGPPQPGRHGKALGLKFPLLPFTQARSHSTGRDGRGLGDSVAVQKKTTGFPCPF
jgi:hypothetical protein